jgi:hypothetical protein
MITSRHVRALWAALLAVMGTVCVTGGASASTGGARAAEMFRKGCCCVTKPASGCCCETKKPLSLNASVAASTAVRRAVAQLEQAEGPRTGSCQCSLTDPAVPGSKSSQGSTERETNDGATLPLEAFAVPNRAAPPFGRYVTSRGSPPWSPLYLRNSRLLI